MRLQQVALYAFTVVIEDRQVAQRRSVTLLGGFAIPLCRLGQVLRHALAARVHEPEVILRVWRAFLSEGLPFFQCSGEIATLIRLQPSIKVGPELKGKQNKEICKNTNGGHRS